MMLTPLRKVGIVIGIGIVWAFFIDDLHNIISPIQYPKSFNVLDLLISGLLCFALGAISFQRKIPSNGSVNQ